MTRVWAILFVLLRLATAVVHPSARSAIESFKVMDMVELATQLEAEGQDIKHLEVGQPSTGAPALVLEAAAAAMQSDRIGYTSAQGIDALRQRIAKHYLEKYGCIVPKERILVTTGSSAAFIFAFLGCFDTGDHVALCSSGYPCYFNDLKALSCPTVSIKVNKQFKVTATELEAEVERRKASKLPPLKGFICSSPSNPTGAMLSPKELQDLCAACEKHGIVFISDEIYHGISYGGQEEATAAQFSDDAIVVNSFSKYYSMTGWRLGWMVLPESLIDTMNRLSQNLYINPPTLSQIAGIRAFDATEELEGHVRKYKENREIVRATLQELGLLEGAAPSDGAFYIYLDLTKQGVVDAPALCKRLLREAKIACTPGVDFESPESGLGLKRIRFSFSRSTEEVREGMRRFAEWWKKNMQ